MNNTNTLPAWLVAKRAVSVSSTNVHTAPMRAPAVTLAPKGRPVCPILETDDSDDNDFAPVHSGDTYTDGYECIDMSFSLEH